jgi:phosphoenolpyruvate phosphomutase
MVQVSGAPLLSHIVDAYNAVGIKNITVVRGYAKETVNLPNLNYVNNDEYADTGELVSLQKALVSVDSGQHTIISYGDVIFKKYIPQALSEEDDDFVVAVDTNWRESANRHRQADYASCSMPNSRRAFSHRIQLNRIADYLPEDRTHGEWMGFLKVSPRGTGALVEALGALLSDRAKRTAKMPVLINELINRGQEVRVIYTTGHWLDIDSLDDVIHAGTF